MWSKLKLIYHTVIHLRWIQVFYQIFYKIRNRVSDPFSFGSLEGYDPHHQNLKITAFSFCPTSTQLEGVSAFTFLNLKHEFDGDIDWNYEGKGKLWNYNLNYFDFLFDPKIGAEDGERLITNYCDQFVKIKGGLEPYPTSLRGMNWIKFLLLNHLKEEKIDRCLFRQYNILAANLEYHILANHLLENAFSLFYGAYYFQNERFYQKAQQLLIAQLKEQILSDGAHYERSPMYHQVLLFRLLDTINLVKNNDWKGKELLNKLVDFAEPMLSWLNTMTFRNGEIPYVKDATKGIAPSSRELNHYASILGLQWNKSASLSDSGYRKLINDKVELLADIGEVGPSYQPGHAHADELNFVMHVNNKPFIVDVGISTYEKNLRRHLERSTISHNCISLGKSNSSEVWGGFRVAKRAKVRLLNDSATEIEAEHTGFEQKGLGVKRKFKFSQNSIGVEDILKGNTALIDATVSMLHFHPDVQLKVSGNDIFAENIKIKLTGFRSFALENYEFACGFNQIKTAKKLVLKPSHQNIIEIYYAD